MSAAQLFKEALAWGATYGPVISPRQWDEMRDRMVAQFVARISPPELLVPGVMRCAKCAFVLTSINLNMGDGTCTAGDNKPEPCPNGCGPLWPMTWEQNYLSLEKVVESQVERALKAEARVAELEAAQAKPPQFPTMLRKMWSGGEVQRWIDENWNKVPASQPAAATRCREVLREQGKASPRTCAECGLGPCRREPYFPA